MSFEEGQKWVPQTDHQVPTTNRTRSNSGASLASARSIQSKSGGKKSGLFAVDRPGNSVHGVTQATGNAVTAALAGGAAFVASPFVAASARATEGEVWQDRTVNCVTGSYIMSFSFRITETLIWAGEEEEHGHQRHHLQKREKGEGAWKESSPQSGPPSYCPVTTELTLPPNMYRFL